MLVYGDHSETAGAQQVVGRIGSSLERIASMPAGLKRHSALVGTFIEAGQLLQGLADQSEHAAAVQPLTHFLVELGGAVCRSWDSDFQAVAPPRLPTLRGLPESLCLKVPEGYAFYALYPEAYAQAARRLALSAPPCVIGIRSIGTSLGAIVAAALGTPDFITVRPSCDPFKRRLEIAPDAGRALVGRDRHFVVVDEGPGLSGSSFGAVADWLEDRGVPVDRIAFIPSHANPPGPKASQAHRERWDRTQREVADLGPELAQLLERWAREKLGPLDAPLQDLSAGAWRQLIYSDIDSSPPVNAGWEARKYLARAAGESWLLKFAGLGELGERKLDRARRLHSEGLVPEPRGLLHGFLVERWYCDAVGLGPTEKPLPELAHYIGTRARLLPATGRTGASLRELLVMAKRNAALGLGTEALEALDRWEPRIETLQKRIVPVETDNRLDRHEWLRLADGSLLKADALDHVSAHDLIGAQDMSWDVAGASVEFELGDPERRELAARCGREAGRVVDPELLDFMVAAYLAFRLGHARLSQDMCRHPEAEGWKLRTEAYEAQLQKLLLQTSSMTTRRSWPLDEAPERTAAGTIPAGFG